MKSNMQDYWNSLERLKNNKPVVLPKGSLINKDTVALEAGRRRGTIKKSRESFSSLIFAIDQAASQVSKSTLNSKNKTNNERMQTNNYRELYHQALNRELMLLDRLAYLEKELKKYDNVIPLI